MKLKHNIDELKALIKNMSREEMLNKMNTAGFEMVEVKKIFDPIVPEVSYVVTQSSYVYQEVEYFDDYDYTTEKDAA